MEDERYSLKINNNQEDEKSIEIILESLKNNPDNDNIKFVLASQYEKLNRKEEAKNLLRELIASEDRNVAFKSFLTLIRINWKSGNASEAIEDFNKFKDLYPIPNMVRYYIGQCYCQIGKPMEALEIASVDRYNSLEFNITRANAYFQMHEYQKALNALEQEVSASSKINDNLLARKYSIKGTIFLKMKMFSPALVAFKLAEKKSINQNRTYFDSKMSIATIYYRLGDKTSAISEALEVLDYCKNQKILSDANNFLGHVYLDIHDADSAYVYFSKCKDKEREMGLAKIDFMNGDFDKALKRLQEIPILNEYTYKEVHTLMAEIMFRLKDYVGFALEYRDIISMSGADGKKFGKDINTLYNMRYFIENTTDIKFEDKVSYANEKYYSLFTDYDVDAAIAKIKENIDSQKETDVKFSKDIDFEGLYRFVLMNIGLYKNERKCSGAVDKYLINLKELECPYSDEIVEVTCCFDSFKIINMYPINYRDNYEKVQARKARQKWEIGK